MTATIEVLAPGALALVEDGGRDLAEWGVARSGAADRRALALANRLTGNAPNAAGLECLLGGVSLRFPEGAIVAMSGAQCQITADRRALDMNRAHHLAAGAVLTMGLATSGLRTYISFRGGIDVEPVLGSRSRDVLAMIGPEPLAVGTTLPIGSETDGDAWFEFISPAPLTQTVTVRVAPGPRTDWFDSSALELLVANQYTVRGESDRTGIRFMGVPLPRRSGDLASEPTLPGSVQVPPDGQPIVLGPDAGVSGGYPVIAAVLDDDLDLLGQVRPGDAVTFRWA